MSQPTEGEITAALASYRQHIVEHNKAIFTQLVHNAETATPPADYSDADAADARREFMLNQLCVSRPDSLAPHDPRRITVPRDVLDRWNDLVALPELALDGTSSGWGVDDADADRRATLREQYRAGVEGGLQQVGENAPPFPADFAALMGLDVLGLVGPGWPLFREQDQGLRFWDGLGETEEDVTERVWTDGDELKEKLVEDSWDVRVGWECGASADAACYIVYFRDPESEDVSKRSWGWRYVMSVDTSLWAFDNVVQLLDFYKTFNEPALERVDQISGRVFS